MWRKRQVGLFNNAHEVDRGTNTGALVSVFGGLVQILRERSMQMRGLIHGIFRRLRSIPCRLRMT